MPSLTLGCGAVGGSATIENVGPMNLLDKRYVAYGQCELEDIRKSIPSARRHLPEHLGWINETDLGFDRQEAWSSARGIKL